MSRFTKKRIMKIKKTTFKRRRRRTRVRCVRKRGGAALPGGTKLPMIIDQNNVMYTCTAIPTA